MDGATVVVAVVTSRIEAELIAGLLRSGGLRAAVAADDAGGIVAGAVWPAAVFVNVVLVSATTVATTPASTVPPAAARSRHLRMDRPVELGRAWERSRNRDDRSVPNVRTND